MFSHLILLMISGNMCLVEFIFGVIYELFIGLILPLYAKMSAILLNDCCIGFVWDLTFHKRILFFRRNVWVDFKRFVYANFNSLFGVVIRGIKLYKESVKIMVLRFNGSILRNFSIFLI